MKKKRTRLQTTVDDDLLTRLKHLALDKKLKVNEMLELMIQFYFDEADKKNSNK